MTRTEYEAKRKTLINEAETLINEGKVDDANEKMNDVTKLDQDFELALEQAFSNFFSSNFLPVSSSNCLIALSN